MIVELNVCDFLRLSFNAGARNLVLLVTSCNLHAEMEQEQVKVA